MAGVILWTLEIIHSVFLAATWHHIVITTGGFCQMSEEVLGLAFIYFIAHSSSAKSASSNCLFNDAQRIEWWPAEVVWNYKNRERTCFFSVYLMCFCSVSIECRLV